MSVAALAGEPAKQAVLDQGHGVPVNAEPCVPSIVPLPSTLPAPGEKRFDIKDVREKPDQVKGKVIRLRYNRLSDLGLSKDGYFFLDVMGDGGMCMWVQFPKESVEWAKKSVEEGFTRSSRYLFVMAIPQVWQTAEGAKEGDPAFVAVGRKLNGAGTQLTDYSW